LQVADSRFQISGCRWQIAGFRFQIVVLSIKTKREWSERDIAEVCFFVKN
jgi:hypothetical protein